MNEPRTCPQCGTHHAPTARACGCGYTFTGTRSTAPGTPSQAKPGTAAPPDTGRPIPIERPFDLGKPLGSPHRVSHACPNCGSTEYKVVKPAAMVAFTWDRVCRSCSMRYTPPAPIWARFIFSIIGLGAITFAAFMAYNITQGRNQGGLGFITPIVVVVVGFGCLYKAVTK